MGFVTRHTNRISGDRFGDIRRSTPMRRRAAAPIGCLSLADAAGIVSAGVGAGALGYAVGHNVH